jgi:hypothetical protein
MLPRSVVSGASRFFLFRRIVTFEWMIISPSRKSRYAALKRLEITLRGCHVRFLVSVPKSRSFTSPGFATPSRQEPRWGPKRAPFRMTILRKENCSRHMALRSGGQIPPGLKPCAFLALFQGPEGPCSLRFERSVVLSKIPESGPSALIFVLAEAS